MIATGGDEDASNAAVERYAARAARLAELIPSIRSGGASSGSSLREAVALLENSGLQNRSSLHGWLARNVQSDDTLRSAGFDPEAVRRIEIPPGLPKEREALLDLLRQHLVRGGVLNQQEIDAYIDVARQAANRLNIGEVTTPNPSAPAPAGSVPVAMLGIPRRV
jgi:hypothetical protein